MNASLEIEVEPLHDMASAGSGTGIATLLATSAMPVVQIQVNSSTSLKKQQVKVYLRQPLRL
jgi:hypothetical protein